MGIVNFKNKGTKDINYGRSSKEALKTLPKELHRKAQIKIARLGAVTSMQDLREIRGNRFEALKGDRNGQFSIRVNEQYRICFRWENENALDVEIVDYH
ncbi:MAG: type II toxin-antitoxin system RelE/ParE family toxin [Deltaproteobacteria bacterium]|nr:type II toxin-antitoxin system RelE/ParE family toxin [Deltaproteobacteria bacterium]